MLGSQNMLLPFKILKFSPISTLVVSTLILIAYGYSFGLFVSQSHDFIKASDYSRLPEITLPYTCDFSDSDLSTPHKYQGWSDAENWGIWSKEENPILAFRLNESSRGKHIRLSFQFHDFYVNAHNKRIKAKVRLNGSYVDTWVFEKRAGLTKEIDLLLDSEDKFLEVEFQLDGILSPNEATGASDQRKLGIGLSSISIQEIETNP